MGQTDDDLPNAISRSGLCTRCGQISRFTISGSYCLGEFEIGYDMFECTASILRCRSCFELMFVLSNDLMPLGSAWEVESFPFYYFPPIESKALAGSMPRKIVSWLDEGQKCLSVGAYRAAVTMFRSAIAEFISINESPTKANDHGQTNRFEVNIRKDKEQPSLIDWANSIKMLRGEERIAERIEKVTKDEALEVASFVIQLLGLQFELPRPLEGR